MWEAKLELGARLIKFTKAKDMGHWWCGWLAHKNRERQKQLKNCKIERPTALRIPIWSPTIVLAQPNAA